MIGLIYPPWSWYPMLGCLVVILVGLLTYIVLEIGDYVSAHRVRGHYIRCPSCHLHNLWVPPVILWNGRPRSIECQCVICRRKVIVHVSTESCDIG